MHDTTFEDRLKELEAIIAHIESGALALKDLVNTHKRGTTLLEGLETELKDAQQLIETASLDGTEA